MLVLTRRIDESLKVGDEVTLTVLRVTGDRVRFGVVAPRDIRVQRAPKEPSVSKAPEELPPFELKG
jgi:carbon storage regulator